MGLFSKKPIPPPKSAIRAPRTQSVKGVKPIAVQQEQMKAFTETIRAADNLNDLLIKTSTQAKETIGADRITIFVVDSINNILGSRVMDGNEVKAIAIPISNTSIAGYIAKNTKPVNIKDAYNTIDLQQNYTGLMFDRTWDKKTGYRTKEVLGIPVMHKGKVQGVIQAINKKDGTDGGFGDNALQTIQEISESLAPDLYKVKSFEDSQREITYQKKLKRITDKMYSASNVENMLAAITVDLKSLFETDGVTIYILDKNSNELVGKYHEIKDLEDVRLSISNNSIAGFTAKNNKMLIIADAYNEAELIKISPELRFDSRWDEKFKKKTKAVIAFPLVFEGSVQGVLELINKKSGFPFGDKDIEITREVGTTLAIAMSRQKRTGAVVGKRTKYNALVSANLITQDKLNVILKTAKENNETPECILIKDCNIPAKEIAKCYQLYFRTDFIGFDPEMPIPVDLIQDLTLEILKHEMWAPIEKEGNVIRIIMEDPNDIIKRDTIQLRFKSAHIKYCVSTKDDIINIIDLFYGVSKAEDSSVAPEDVENILDELKDEMSDKDKQEEAKTELKEDDSAIVRLVNQIIEQAYARKASDIHIEPYTETDTIVRIRIDGTCQEIMKVPRHYKNAVSSRIKIMSNLDIAQRRMPQDGKIKFKNFGKLDIELRVAVIPTVGGNEDIVMRILASSKPIPLDKMGMSKRNYDRFVDILKKPYGICLVVGPTGSGKTTTLHSALGFINTIDRKIWTAEDPVEITQYQLRQVQVLPKIDFTFERAMRAFLRGDPDVIMVGEMRDLETTSTGLEASLTGHLVFSTLHTNNAPETITRLLDMGIDPFSFADAVLGILAQRLLKTVCKDCKEEYHPSKKEFEHMRSEYDNNELFDKQFKYTPGLMLFRAKEDGCKKCNNRGYRGRMGIHELLYPSDEMKGLIHKKPKASDVMAQAIKDGMVTLKQDGIEKVFGGNTTLQDVLAVCMK